MRLIRKKGLASLFDIDVDAIDFPDDYDDGPFAEPSLRVEPPYSEVEDGEPDTEIELDFSSDTTRV